MAFRIQFINAAGKIVAEWFADAVGVHGAIELVDGLEWPRGAARLRIVDADGRVVHAEMKIEPQPPA